jgi:hypothetical protein
MSNFPDKFFCHLISLSYGNRIKIYLKLTWDCQISCSLNSNYPSLACPPDFYIKKNKKNPTKQPIISLFVVTEVTLLSSVLEGSSVATSFLALIGFKVLSWSLSYGSWIYSYLCNQVSITTNIVSSNPAQERCTRYNIMWESLSVTCGRSVVFSRYSGFLHQ